MDETVRALIEHYGMVPLPVEGTYFVSTYRSAADTPTSVGSGPVGTVSALTASHPDRADDIRRLAVPDDHGTAMPDGFAT